jgi:hypothetical protein
VAVVEAKAAVGALAAAWAVAAKAPGAPAAASKSRNVQQQFLLLAINGLIFCSPVMSALIQSGHRPLDVSKAETRQRTKPLAR